MVADLTQQTMELLSRLPRIDTREFNSQLHPVYDQTHVGLSITPANILFALHRAREARALAVSYRNFNVGAALIALSIGSPRFQVLSGVNVKPDAESAMNVHAEQVALQKFHDREYSAVSIVAVVGETQNDQQSGQETPTLHPCGLCREVMANHVGIHNEHTLIVSALPNLRTIEAYSLASLSRFHTSGDRSGIKLFKFPELEILKPLNLNASNDPVNVSALDDGGEVEWNDSIGLFSLEWRQKLLNGE